MTEHKEQQQHVPGAVPGWEAGLADALGVWPHPASLFLEALTHPSYPAEAPPPKPAHYQRLEFVGDAVIGLVAAHMLWQRFPARSEGELARMRAALVNTGALAEVARQLGLGRWLRMGRGEELSGGRDRDSTLCDALEAVTGALFVAYGWETAAAFVRRILTPGVERLAADDQPVVDPKSRLQELLQHAGGEVPEYELVGVEGPDHARTFTVVVRWQGKELGRGRGSSKKAAQQEAAADALARLQASEAPVERDDAP